MSTPKTPQMARGRGRPRGPAKLLVPVHMEPHQRKRLKMACAEDGVTYEQFLVNALDKRERNKAQARRAQAHPLHQPVRKSHYPGGGA